MAKQTPAQLKAISKYQSKLDTITFRVPKGEKAKEALNKWEQIEIPTKQGQNVPLTV